MLFVLDNYDSFTYNLVQYLGELGAEPVVYRNDALSVADVLALKPVAAVLSPGPRTPSDAGILVPLVKAKIDQPDLAFGGRVVRAERLMHGKTCAVMHDGDDLFAGIPSPLTGMRYHSLVVQPESLPAELVVTAWSADRPKGGGGEIMAMRHRSHPIYGVQFHPESIGTEHGKRLLENFLRVAPTVV